MNKTLATLLAVAFSFAPAPPMAAAQDLPPEEESPEGPATASASVTVDDEQAELEQMQREAEAAESAPADQVVTEPAPAEEEVPADSLHHASQVGIRAGIAVPYVFAVKYGTGPRCGDGGETFCRRLGAALVDLELGFGVSEGVELSLLARLGLADDAAANARPVAFGLGVRAYGSPHSMVKLYFGGRVVLDVTSSQTEEWSSVDVGGRGELGLQVDFVRYVGMYLQLGETLTVLRGFYFVTDLSAGVQARFP